MYKIVKNIKKSIKVRNTLILQIIVLQDFFSIDQKNFPMSFKQFIVLIFFFTLVLSVMIVNEQMKSFLQTNSLERVMNL